MVLQVPKELPQNKYSLKTARCLRSVQIQGIEIEGEGAY